MPRPGGGGSPGRRFWPAPDRAVNRRHSRRAFVACTQPRPWRPGMCSSPSVPTEPSRLLAATPHVGRLSSRRCALDPCSASRHGMCSPPSRSGSVRQDAQRFRWSSTRWSPPPESNRRPHPYHGTTGNRCADWRSPRSRSTVRVKVIGSAPTQLWGHSRQQSSEQYGSSRQSVTAASAAARIAAPSTSRRDDQIPRSGQVQTKASGPGGGRGRTR